MQGAVVLTKQAFKWGWRQCLLREYRLASVSFPQAKARPQPCFTTVQVEALLKATSGEEQVAFALMAYAGLRIGEVEQLRWEDLRQRDGRCTMIHVRRGGSADTTKDKDERFVPVHPRIAQLLGGPKKTGSVFKTIAERSLLARLKALCKSCGFEKPDEYKLHSFRHHFASLCANHGVAHRKALAWLGHSSSDMLDLYYHLHDDESEQAMLALAAGGHGIAATVDATEGAEGGSRAVTPRDPTSPAAGDAHFEGSLRAIGQSTIEHLAQAPERQELAKCVLDGTERMGFEPMEPCGSPVFKTGALSHSATSP